MQKASPGSVMPAHAQMLPGSQSASVAHWYWQPHPVTSGPGAPPLYATQLPNGWALQSAPVTHSRVISVPRQVSFNVTPHVAGATRLIAPSAHFTKPLSLPFG